jgi:hypothetical protein
MHIVNLEDGLGCIECFSNDEEQKVKHVCWSKGWVGSSVERYIGIAGDVDIPQLYRALWLDPKRNRPARLSLLLLPKGVSYTCLNYHVDKCLHLLYQRYSEAIQVLYSQNIFSFRSIQTIFQFTNSILTSRLDQVRAIEVDWDPRLFRSRSPPADRETWNSVWRLLADLPALRKLTVRLHAGGVLEHPSCDLNEALPICEPICWVTQVDEFIVEAPPLGGHPNAPFKRFDELLDSAPFRLVELHALRPPRNFRSR